MNDEAAFFLSPVVLNRYRQLRFRGHAQQIWNVLPFSTVFWDDEHPLKNNGLPDLPVKDEESRLSIIRLVAARTEFWLQGAVPKQLQRIWDEANAALPDWPGFKRLVLSNDQLQALQQFRDKVDAVERALLASDREASVEIDDTGISRVTLKLDIRDRGRPWWKFWA